MTTHLSGFAFYNIIFGLIISIALIKLQKPCRGTTLRLPWGKNLPEGKRNILLYYVDCLFKPKIAWHPCPSETIQWACEWAESHSSRWSWEEGPCTVWSSSVLAQARSPCQKVQMPALGTQVLFFIRMVKIEKKCQERMKQQQNSHLSWEQRWEMRHGKGDLLGFEELGHKGLPVELCSWVDNSSLWNKTGWVFTVYA
jgi:hypothetical protein